ncbi:proline-rich receptor-like protein kinase PERK2 [Fukomys damarensis]|uniref:proline-rich receptor-like protein kinase PERK2 n=1 Tax=Fukomys damarensis TaxID=885580 RepID=UPI0014555ECD|nr:proline-rich receptor-like protein kinase PERK2 [Fukomys damarensis]
MTQPGFSRVAAADSPQPHSLGDQLPHALTNPPGALTRVTHPGPTLGTPPFPFVEAAKARGSSALRRWEGDVAPLEPRTPSPGLPQPQVPGCTLCTVCSEQRRGRRPYPDESRSLSRSPPAPFTLRLRPTPLPPNQRHLVTEPPARARKAHFA